MITPYAVGESVEVLHLTDTGVTRSTTVVIAVERARSGRWMVTVAAPAILPARHLDPYPDTYQPMPRTLTTYPEHIRRSDAA